jgi:hypothetical protein
MTETIASRLLVLLTAGLAFICPAPAHGQQGKLTDFTIEGHVYEPQRLAPTNERVRSLRMASGFALQRFADQQPE